MFAISLFPFPYPLVTLQHSIFEPPDLRRHQLSAPHLRVGRCCSDLQIHSCPSSTTDAEVPTRAIIATSCLDGCTPKLKWSMTIVCDFGDHLMFSSLAYWWYGRTNPGLIPHESGFIGWFKKIPLKVGLKKIPLSA